MAAHFSTASQCQIPCCYTCGLVSAGATQGELSEGAREGPLGDNNAAQLVYLDTTDSTCEFHLSVNS